MITRRAQQVIRRHQAKPPVDVTAIARELGLEVYAEDGLSDDVSGLLTKDDKGYFIVVNRGHHLNRRRFTIAHEIAHFLLHRDEIGDGVEDSTLYRSHLSGRQETQANRLAAEILMPWRLISHLVRQNPHSSVEFLAQELKVSKSAMAIRLGVPTD